MAVKPRFIIDTDPGIDDFFALLLAAGSPEIEVCGITAVSGNQDLRLVSHNALAAAEFLGLKVPVAAGAASPLLEKPVNAAHFHGASGLGPLILPAPASGLDRRHAWDFIYEEAAGSVGLGIIAIGPLTNIAVALLRYPELPRYIDRIISMGGSASWGNRGAYGEFNYFADPLAAQIVYNSGIPIDMIGLNVTMKTGISPKDRRDIGAMSFPHKASLMELLDFYCAASEDSSYHIAAMHDSLAVAYAIEPELLTMRSASVLIDTSYGLNRGRSLIRWDEGLSTRVAVDVDNQRFMELVKNSFLSLR